jgi:hypothetical protein
VAEALDQPTATLYVRIENVSRADTAADIVAEASIPVHRPLAAGDMLPFALEIPDVDEQAQYSLRVHLDTTGTRHIDPGDRISMQSYPVATFGHPDEAIIVAKKV